jgi:protein O-GlcNAc transferase
MFGRIFSKRHTPAHRSESQATAELDSHLAQGRESEAAGRLGEARDHYAAAVAIAPTHVAAQLDLGSVLEALNDAGGALQAYQAALAADPADPYANYNVGRLLHLRGDRQGAESRLRAALAAREDFPQALVTLSRVLEAGGDYAAALGKLEEAAARHPDYAAAQGSRGMLLVRMERWQDAVEPLRSAADLDPLDAEAPYWLGNALVKLDRPGEALEAYRAATARRPAFAEAWCQQGNVLADRGSRQEALACFARALELRPDYADAHLGLGNVYGVSERLEDAADHFRRAIQLNPALALAHLNLGIVLSDQGLQADALASFRAALALNPEWPEARWAYAIAHVPTLRGPDDRLPEIRRRIAGAFEELARWFEAHPRPDAYRAVGIQQPFWLAYQEEDNRPLLEAYGGLCGRLMAPRQAQLGLRPRAARSAGRLRVGIVSHHLRDHSVWHAIVRGWFAQLDPRRFALLAFCLDPNEDEETRFARSRSARFEQGHIGLERWSEVIAEAQPDVLLYPEIGMDPMTLRLASLRLAPLQAASWGHPETTGLPTIDSYLSAEGLEPAGAAAYYAETLVELPHLGCFVQDRRFEAAPGARTRLEVPPDVPLLVSAGTPFKYAPEHDRVYAEIARRLGRCRMIFFRHKVRTLAEQLEARLRDAFASQGLRLDEHARFLPWQDRAAFLGLLRDSDVFLDTIGFSGFNTALQAVEAGLPVVTRDGRFLRGRLASGILRRLGLEELVAADDDGYIERAVRLAREPGYRDGIRRRMAAARAVLYEDLEPIRALERFLDQGL